MTALDDSANTDRCTLYQDSANFLKDECFTKAEYQTSANLCKMNAGERGHKNHRVSLRVKVRQNLSKRLKARQMCVDDDDENAISKKLPLLIAQDTQ